MFSKIKGTVSFVEKTHDKRERSPLLVMTDGAHFSIMCVAPFFETIKEGHDIELLLFDVFNSETGVKTYGFVNLEQWKFFRAIITIDKIGPMKAIDFMSGAEFEDLCAIIRAKDVKKVAKFEGIGPKSAEIIVNSLVENL